MQPLPDRSGIARDDALPLALTPRAVAAVALGAQG